MFRPTNSDIESNKFCYAPGIEILAKNHKYDDNVENIKTLIKNTQVGYECFKSKCIPFYDFDKNYKFQDIFKDNIFKDFDRCYTVLSNYYLNDNYRVKIICFNSSGYDELKGIYRMSFHFLIRGWGYHQCGRDVKLFDEVDFDKTVYTKLNKWQKFRLPYCKKYNNSKRIKKRVWRDPNTTTFYTAADLQECEMKGECLEEYLVQYVTKEKERRPPQQNITQDIKKNETRKKQIEEIDSRYPDNNYIYNKQEIEELIHCLNYFNQKWVWGKWIKIIWILKSIAHTNNIDLKNLAHRISNQNDKYNYEITEQKYIAEEGKKENVYNIGTLINIINIDEQGKKQYITWKDKIKQKEMVKLYSEIKSEHKEVIVDLLMSEKNDDDFAEYFVKIYGQDYKYCEGNLYYFNGVYWNNFKQDFTKINEILGEKIYFTLKFHIPVILEGKNKDEVSKLNLNKINSLRNVKSRNGIIKSILQKINMYDPRQDIWDSKENIVTFNNGVWDLTCDQFMEGGKREDFITQHIPYNYQSVTQQQKNKLMTWFDQIMPREDERDFLIKALSATLHGRLLENFIILQGKGRNGKDTLITQLFKHAIGEDYYYYGNSNTITSEISKGAINQEKANIHNKRCVVYSEPCVDMNLKTSTIKELTGCSEINARGLYSKVTRCVNVATNFCLVNKLPKLSSIDQGISNRLIIIPFRSLFRTPQTIKTYPPGTTYLYPVDSYYKSREFIEQNKLILINILLDYFKIFRQDGYILKNIPRAMEELKKQYIGDSDSFMCWYNDKYTFTGQNKDFVQIKDLYNEFKRSDLWENMTKKKKREMSKKNITREIKDNPNLRMYYKESIQRMTQVGDHDTKKKKKYKNVILQYTFTKEDLNSDSDTES